MAPIGGSNVIHAASRPIFLVLSLSLKLNVCIGIKLKDTSSSTKVGSSIQLTVQNIDNSAIGTPDIYYPKLMATKFNVIHNLQVNVH